AGGFEHLEKVSDARGRLGYRQSGDFRRGPEALTSMGALCLLLAGGAPNVPAAVESRVLDQVVRAGASVRLGSDLYRDYFIAEALRAHPSGGSRPAGGESDRSLLAQQVGAGGERGSWEPQAASAPGGRVCSTALAALILEARRQQR